MIGSEAQIAYAQEVKAKIMLGLSDLICDAQREVDKKTLPGAWLEITHAEVDARLAEISTIQRAEVVINLRTEPVAERVHDKIVSRMNKWRAENPSKGKYGNYPHGKKVEI